MFPLQQIDELVDQHQVPLPANSATPYSQLQHQIHQDLFWIDGGHAPLVTTSNINISDNVSNNYYYNSNNIVENEVNNNYQIHFDAMLDNKLKKIVHRDIERQRRQAMATLHSSLRSLLPLEFIKGKSSISDHMQQSVNYIKYLQKNIKGLEARRDELISKSGTEVRQYEVDPPSCAIIINQFNGGLEILISANNVKGNESPSFPLSIVLRALMEERTNPVSCISSKENTRSLWRIQCEVNDEASIEIPDLQRKISDLVVANLGYS